MGFRQMELNCITDDGASTILETYQSWLANGVDGIRKYEAHLNIGLLAWRAGSHQAMSRHLRTAVAQMLDVQYLGLEGHAVVLDTQPLAKCHPSLTRTRIAMRGLRRLAAAC